GSSVTKATASRSGWGATTSSIAPAYLDRSTTGGSMRLVLLRHAQAAPTGAGGDRDRPLLAEGRQQVASVGARLQALGWWPDKALVSPALRARQTHEALVPPIPAEVDDEVYTGGALAIRRRLLDAGDGLVIVI